MAAGLLKHTDTSEAMFLFSRPTGYREGLIIGHSMTHLRQLWLLGTEVLLIKVISKQLLRSFHFKGGTARARYVIADNEDTEKDGLISVHVQTHLQLARSYFHWNPHIWPLHEAQSVHSHLDPSVGMVARSKDPIWQGILEKNLNFMCNICRLYEKALIILIFSKTAFHNVYKVPPGSATHTIEQFCDGVWLISLFSSSRV